ncbi:MAG: TonB-dependent receptor plug domain-containing protein [Opitutaceae bacterium]|nr:TonB-dependent receptor plug domain-containing protein [Opitutaceae bacterium]
MSSLRLLPTLSLVLATSALAQSAADPIIHLYPFTVIAHPSGADERAAAVWVAAPELAAPAPLHTADLLLSVPGAHVDQPGGPGGRATLYLRGAEENHTVAFLDGIPLNDPTNNRGGAVNFSLIEPSLLGQVAVVRGAPSVSYGPDALAGVVHLNSDTAAGSRLFFEAGGNDLVRGGFNGTETIGTTAAPVSLSLGAAAADEGSLTDGSRAQRRIAAPRSPAARR